jgi:ribosomal protein L29
MTKNTEIIKKSSTDLAKGVVEKREELRKVRFSIAGAGAKDVMKTRNLRKEIARSLTELNKRKQDVTTETK